MASSDSKAFSLPLNLLLKLLALDPPMADFISDYSETPDMTRSGDALPQPRFRYTEPRV